MQKLRYRQHRAGEKSGEKTGKRSEAANQAGGPGEGGGSNGGAEISLVLLSRPADRPPQTSLANARTNSS